MKLDVTHARPLIDASGHAGLRAALANYDRALHDLSALGATPPDQHRRQAEAEHRAELDAAALDSRPPRTDRSALAAADLADLDHADRLAATQRAIARREVELDAACADVEASTAMLGAIGRRRAEILGEHNDPGSQPGDPLFDLSRVYVDPLVFPANGYVPGEVRLSGWRLVCRAWWPLVLGGSSAVYQLDHYAERYDYNEWAWERLAGARFTIDDEGRIRFGETWRCTTGARFLNHHDVAAAAGYSPPNVHVFPKPKVGLREGALIWLGTGPDGEQGITDDDLDQHQGLAPITTSW
jgi:hypothetical protein